MLLLAVFPRAEFNLGLYDRICGQYLDLRLCKMEWSHEDEAEVGGSSGATVRVRN